MGHQRRLPKAIAGRLLRAGRITLMGALQQRPGGRGVVFRIVARGQRETVLRVGTARVFVDECARNVGPLPWLHQR